MEKVKENGVNSKDLKKAKKIARAGFIRALETAAGRTRDMSISEALAGNYDFSQNYLNRLDNVTGSRIISAAKQYLGVNSLNTVILMPEEEEKIAAAAEKKPASRSNRKIVKTEEEKLNRFNILDIRND